MWSKLAMARLMPHQSKALAKTFTCYSLLSSIIRRTSSAQLAKNITSKQPRLRVDQFSTFDREHVMHPSTIRSDARKKFAREG